MMRLRRYVCGSNRVHRIINVPVRPSKCKYIGIDDTEIVYFHLCHPAIQPYMAIFLYLSASKDECLKTATFLPFRYSDLRSPAGCLQPISEFFFISVWCSTEYGHFLTYTDDQFRAGMQQFRT